MQPTALLAVGVASCTKRLCYRCLYFRVAIDVAHLVLDYWQHSAEQCCTSLDCDRFFTLKFPLVMSGQILIHTTGIVQREYSPDTLTWGVRRKYTSCRMRCQISRRRVLVAYSEWVYLGRSFVNGTGSFPQYYSFGIIFTQGESVFDTGGCTHKGAYFWLGELSAFSQYGQYIIMGHFMQVKSVLVSRRGLKVQSPHPSPTKK